MWASLSRHQLHIGHFVTLCVCVLLWWLNAYTKKNINKIYYKQIADEWSEKSRNYVKVSTKKANRRQRRKQQQQRPITQPHHKIHQAADVQELCTHKIIIKRATYHNNNYNKNSKFEWWFKWFRLCVCACSSLKSLSRSLCLLICGACVRTRHFISL